jgi:phosphoenolpyruvate carboxylase
MASQHPDHASTPWWNSDALIDASQETKETMIAFEELGIDEYMWDWEGKLVDESVTERLLAQNYDYFQKNPLGEERFLTYRLPNPFVETEFRLGRAFLGLISADSLAKKTNLPTPPLFEAILPMCENAKSLIDIQEAFREMAGLKHWLFNTQRGSLHHLEPIPLFEQVEVITNSDQILAEYVKMHEEKFGYQPKQIRLMVARSDPSLNAGHLANLLAIKIALSRFEKFSQTKGVQLYPIIGCGSLPFRGGLTPNNVSKFVAEYSGIKTVMIQSAFRYDFPKDQVVAAIRELNELLPQNDADVLDDATEQDLLRIMQIFKKHYQNSIATVAELVSRIAPSVPKRRERVQHVGLFGYSRGVGGVSLPRAIKYTASMYSVGLPPELIGTGRGLQEIKELGLLDNLRRYYLNFQDDYQRLGGFLNKANLAKLAEQNTAWEQVQADVEELENVLGFDLRPRTDEEIEHQEISTQVLEKLEKGEDISNLITQGGILRKSLG